MTSEERAKACVHDMHAWGLDEASKLAIQFLAKHIDAAVEEERKAVVTDITQMAESRIAMTTVVNALYGIRDRIECGKHRQPPKPRYRVEPINAYAVFNDSGVMFGVACVTQDAAQIECDRLNGVRK